MMTSITKTVLLTFVRGFNAILWSINLAFIPILAMSFYLTQSLSIILPFIFTFILLNFILYWIKTKVFLLLEENLAPVTELEAWAEKNYVENVIYPISLNNAIGSTIAKLQQQLLTESGSANSFYVSLTEKALLDKDTGIGNREFFNNQLEAMLKEDDCQGAVYFIQFKDVDLVTILYGEQETIILLNTLVQNLQFRLKKYPTSFIARRGELELAVIVPDIFFNDAEKLAEMFMVSLSAVALPEGISKDEFVHIGVSYFSQADNPYQIKSEADMALRSAQLEGPSQWFMYNPGEVEHASAKGSLKWRTFLNHAVEKNAFVIFFQPVISSKNEQVLHHEVLSKVRDIDGRLISARVFLPMAQNCGLSQKIDLLIFQQVCRILTYDSIEQDSCSLNFSIESLLSAKFIEQFMMIFNKYENIHSRLIIEISEYHLVNQLEQLKPILAKLAELGIKLLVDKVGQHIVSAHYLKVCPIQYIKLHRSIVLNIHNKPENQIFVQSLKVMTEGQNVDVYALGVESLDEWQTLKRLGVNGGQGHFFTEPVAQVAKAIHLP